MAASRLFSVTGPHFKLSVQRMMDEYEIYGVREKPPGFAFETLTGADELRLDYNISVLPPNKFFIPQVQPLTHFNLNSRESTAVQSEARPTIILGIHPYDLCAIKILDAVYTSNVIDTNYLNRRRSTLIIGTDCLHPWPFSFAASMGTAWPPEIFDLWVSRIEDNFLVEVGSVKGNVLLRRFFETESASPAEEQQRERHREDSLLRYNLALDISPEEVPAVLDKGWSSPMWEELGRKCFSCSSCTMVCPTCVCFDVKDRVELNTQKGVRYRHWDSCMFFGFDTITGGHSLRPTGTERLRHRLHRKGKYMLERWGELGCVGCGRCVHACLVDIASPVYAYNRLAKEAK
jgi:formate hydrogenlyase subunit 6/NADH:ubiquinone oxidoreductase subunit I